LAIFIGTLLLERTGKEVRMGFGPEAIAEMGEILDAAFEKLQDTGEPEVVRERIATRIMTAARLGERDPARLMAAALRRSD
jgi:hypothetical protein